MESSKEIIEIAKALSKAQAVMEAAVKKADGRETERLENGGTHA